MEQVPSAFGCVVGSGCLDCSGDADVGTFTAATSGLWAGACQLAGLFDRSAVCGGGAAASVGLLRVLSDADPSGGVEACADDCGGSRCFESCAVTGPSDAARKRAG